MSKTYPTIPLPRPTQLAHSLLANILQPGEFVVDATAGNGHDTVFLARQVGPSGHVLALDILPAAIAATSQRCLAENIADRVSLRCVSHEKLAEEIKRLGRENSQPGAVVFNLGYLPGGDKSQVTRSSTTLIALEQAHICLRVGGILSVLCYPGHPEGAEEYEAVENWARDLSRTECLVARYGLINPRSPAPVLLVIQRTAPVSVGEI